MIFPLLFVVEGSKSYLFDCFNPLFSVYCCQRQAVVLAGGELGGGLLHCSSGVCISVPEQKLAR